MLLFIYIFSYITTEAKDRDVNGLLSASNVLLSDCSRAVWICLHRWSEQYRQCSGTQPSHIHYDKWTVVCKLAYSYTRHYVPNVPRLCHFQWKLSLRGSDVSIKRVFVRKSLLIWQVSIETHFCSYLTPDLQSRFSIAHFLSHELWMANCESVSCNVHVACKVCLCVRTHGNKSCTNS